MNKSKLIQEIYFKYGIISENKVRQILANDYHMLNESKDDLLVEGIVSGLKKFGSAVAQIISGLSKKLGGAIVEKVQKFGQFLLSFKNKNWQGYADPNSGTMIIGLYSKSGNFNFTGNTVDKNPVMFMNNKLNGKKPIPESFIQKLSKELLNEVVDADETGEPSDAEVAQAHAKLGDYVRQADIEGGEKSDIARFNSPVITIEQYGAQVLPRFLKQIDARIDEHSPTPSFMLIGPPGIAKTYFTRAATAVGYKVINWELAGEQDFTVKGIPIITTNDKGEKVTEYIPPKKLPRSEGNYVLFFDEFNRAQKEVYNVVMTFINEGTLGDYQAPLHTGVALACNAGDMVIDAEDVKDVAETIFQRLKSTYVLKYDPYSDVARTMAKAGRKDLQSKEQNSWHAKSASEKIRSAMGIDDPILPEAQKIDWVKDLGATTKITGNDVEVGEMAAFKNPIDGKTYGFKMGGELAPIIENWKKYRSSGETGDYENTSFFQKAKEELEADGAGVKINSTGKDFSFPVKKPILGSGGETGGRKDYIFIGKSARELVKISNNMKSDAIYDFMNTMLYGAKLSAKLQSTKPVDYYIKNWESKGFNSALEFFFIVNQEYYLQKAAPSIASKTKEDQDVWVNDMLGFYKREKEKGRILDSEVALMTFSKFTPQQIKTIEDMKDHANKAETGDIDVSEKEKDNSIKRIMDVRNDFTLRLADLLNKYDTVQDFVKATKTKLMELSTNKKDIEDIIQIKDIENILSSKDTDDIYMFVAENIDKVIEVLDIQTNGIVNMLAKEKMKTPFAKEIWKALNVLSDKVGTAEGAKSEADTLHKTQNFGNDIGAFLDDFISGGKSSGASSETSEPAKRGRGRPPKPKTEEVDDISLGFKKLFEALK